MSHRHYPATTLDPSILDDRAALQRQLDEKNALLCRYLMPKLEDMLRQDHAKGGGGLHLDVMQSRILEEAHDPLITPEDVEMALKHMRHDRIVIGGLGPRWELKDTARASA